MPQAVKNSFNELKIHDAIEQTFTMIRKVNAYLEKKSPWKTIKEDDSQKGSAATTLTLSAEILRISTQLLHPIMPEKTNSILNILGCTSIPSLNTSLETLKPNTELGEGKTPFPRILIK